MSYTRHHAIIVTGRYDVDISFDRAARREHGLHWADHAHRKAVEVFRGIAPVSDVLDIGLNNVRSFFVGPDGSGEGWEESDRGDAAREEFVAWLRRQSYGFDENGDYEGSPLAWVVVQYGDEMLETMVVTDSDEEARLAGDGE